MTSKEWGKLKRGDTVYLINEDSLWHNGEMYRILPRNLIGQVTKKSILILDKNNDKPLDYSVYIRIDGEKLPLCGSYKHWSIKKND